ncbi:hypothetical protein [Crocosphaera sp.]|uniref:hypothetical protein n=1 Tax=Crocosphaera sp. TaxID=2729996 RepID=UPI002602FFC1|nr:hypothetical protein [Crocosphaera sp.]MDJ0581104.1 hypothetical protein [Crocosphaera sp.]
MDEETKQEIQELKTVIHLLCTEMTQHFSKLSEDFSLSEELQKQLIKISDSKQSIKKEKTQNINDKNINLKTSDSPKVLERPNYKEATSNKIQIDYSYINSEIHHSWVKNLKEYNNHMIELAVENSGTKFINFCYYAIKSIEGSIEELFDLEFGYICSEDNKFLEAYNCVYLDYEGRNFKLPPKICVETNNLKAEVYKKIGSKKYLDKNAIDSILKNSQQTALDIFFSMLDFKYIKKKNLRSKYFLIKDIKQFRNIESHGTNQDVEDRIRKDVKKKSQWIYFPNPKYKEIKDVVDWFVQEIYNRICEISR